MTPAISDDSVDSPNQAPLLPTGRTPTRLSSLHQRLAAVFASLPGSPVRWSRATCGALLALTGLWAALFYATWAKWGNLSVDSGREMYVPAMLAAGKMLYRDLWFLHGPAAPYFNSYLFRLFGIHLNVLYWAGSLAALGSAIFLYLTGMTLGSWVIGWTAGAIVLLEAFEPGLFCFPLPYSFAAVYGCLTACIFLWLIVQATRSERWIWMCGAGCAAAIALLLKLEFGVACYGALLLLMVTDSLRQQSWKPIRNAVLALLPGVLACLVVTRWMVSIAGPDFITQENFLVWPTSYFMKAYGKMWLAHTGFDTRWEAIVGAFVRVSTFAGIALGTQIMLRRRHAGQFLFALGLAVVLLSLVPPALVIRGGELLLDNNMLSTMVRYLSICAAIAMARYLFLNRTKATDVLVLVILGLVLALAAACLPVMVQQVAVAVSRIFYPVDMVLIVGLAAALWWVSYAKGSFGGSLAIGILFAFSLLLAFRMSMGMYPEGYPIYYAGPVILSFLFLVYLVVPELRRSATRTFRAEAIVCGCCFLWVIPHAQVFKAQEFDLKPLTTERGVVWTSEHLANNYQRAIAFMKAKAAAGESVLSVPEDTSLYFLSGTICPIRVYLFTPGVLVPGKMTEETIGEIESKKVRYLLWSNRAFPEYGVPVFGVDFDTTFAAYLKSHYRLVGPLIDNNDEGWNATIWERIPNSASR